MEIRLELLKFSYWEHFKMAKDLALVLSIDHPKRKAIEKEVNDISDKIKALEELMKKNEKHIK